MTDQRLKQYAVWNIQNEGYFCYPDCLATTYERRYAEEFVTMLNNSGRSYTLQIQKFCGEEELNEFYDAHFFDETPEPEEDEDEIW